MHTGRAEQRGARRGGHRGRALTRTLTLTLTLSLTLTLTLTLTPNPNQVSTVAAPEAGEWLGMKQMLLALEEGIQELKVLPQP